MDERRECKGTNQQQKNCFNRSNKKKAKKLGGGVERKGAQILKIRRSGTNRLRTVKLKNCLKEKL